MPDPKSSANGWFEQYVVHRLDELAEQVSCIDKKLDAVRQTLPRLDERVRITAVIFGVLGGFLPALAALIYWAAKGGAP